MAGSAFEVRFRLVQDAHNVFSICKETCEAKRVRNICCAKRESKNRDAAQQSFLVGALIAFGYEVSINRLYKRGNLTFQMFTIPNIRKNGVKVFDADHLGFEYKTLKEKRQILDAITNNTMVYLLEQNRCYFEERKTRKITRDDGISMKRLNSAIINGRHFDLKQINEAGCHFNQTIRTKITTKEGMTIKPFDSSFETSSTFSKSESF
ncbi:hypothetical protein EIN_173590 [Entamoeba invadens IP1]|uniref:Uncharacterized protein n=1 Tax=Entamoeba invadens IP1 TaxID=370355 RepID=A0A0A1TVY9_ENTIV|nr:hypothetical protein EIN_173590 [Entamoeba invadens IP1]ELP84684.1 hypothetical protein EIN_173590 [Entamoeba invadens IP1]|eukprot:XP_004184030.1 hypothetical protein EIN_173590 [Entamoeba invadens IP1]